MIPKIICFIFGHIRSKHVNQTYQMLGDKYIEKYQLLELNVCPRCGKNLLTSNKEK